MKLNRHLYINGQEVDLNNDEPIPLTKQVNNIAELKDRQCDFTTDFKIPTTRKNRAIFENANLFSSKTYVPYVKNSCTYIEDGIELISNGYIVLLSSTDDYFNCAAYSGTADFFKLIDKLKINSVNLTDLATTINNSIFSQNLGDLRWLVFEPSKGGDGLQSGKTTIFNFRPFVKLKRIFKQIIEDQNWTLTGDFDKIEGWTICPNLKPDFSSYIAEAKINEPLSGGALFEKDKAIVVSNSYGLIKTTASNTTLLFMQPRKGKYRYTVKGKFLLNGAGSLKVHAFNMIYVRRGAFYNIDSDVIIAQNNNFGIIQDFDVVYEYDSDSANFEKCLTFGVSIDETSGTIYDFSVKCNLVESEVLLNDSILPSSILPEVEQSKFLKSIANMYGFVFSVNSRKREVNVWQFDTLLKNIYRAKDWSAYLDNAEEVLSYKIGEYAQNNIMKYKELEDVPSGYGDGSLFVNDSTLENSKELFSVDFSACNDILYKNNVISKISVCEKEDAIYKNTDSNDPRLVLDKPVTNASFVCSDGNITFTTTNYQAAYFADTSIGKSLAFGYSLIPQNYLALSSVLNSAKKLEIKMSIPAIEIQNLDHSIPVYLKQYQSYFYVNKVNGWTKQKRCTVELIKLA